MTEAQLGAVCPRCGSTAEVHSIQELADLAQMQLGQVQQATGAAPQQGWNAEPQQGPVPGYAGQPRSGPLPGAWQGGSYGIRDAIGDDIADIALGAATRFIGRAIGRRVQRTMTEKVVPTVMARQQDVLRERIAIAERYPELRACLKDQVIFLAGGANTVLMSSVNLGTVTLAQADDLVTRLRSS